jgi:hypothetical protein
MRLIMSLSPAKKTFVDLASAKYGEGAILTRDELKVFVKEIGYEASETGLGKISWFVRAPYRVGTGKFKLPVDGEELTPVKLKPMKVPVMKKIEKTEEAVVAYHNPTENLVPEKDPLYVPFGNYNDIYNIIKSGRYYPAFITGLSGNGKTFMVEQACAKAKREFFRVNITVETDEDDLLGHYALIDGNTVWQDGPVVKAMERGAILLLDEIDLASSKIMCLQPVLEGKGVYLKKVNRFVSPSVGFNVLATANTKGKGSEDGRYSGASVIDDAFLERFTITLEQTFPGTVTEEKIVLKHMQKFEVIDEEFAKLLVGWADAIRKTFYDEGIDEVISTRRLCHIVQTFSIFGKRDKAIALCVKRFDDDTKAAFIDLYEKVDATINSPEEIEEEYEV